MGPLEQTVTFTGTPQLDYVLGVGVPPSLLEATGSGGGAITYVVTGPVSENPVNPDNTFSFTGPGTVTVTATAAAVGNEYTIGSASYTFKVRLQPTVNITPFSSNNYVVGNTVQFTITTDNTETPLGISPTPTSISGNTYNFTLTQAGYNTISVLQLQTDTFAAFTTSLGQTVDTGNTGETVSVFTVNSNGLITGCTSNLTGEVTIPSSISGINITGIGAGVFQNQNITRILLRTVLTSIGAQAFLGCTQLTTIEGTSLSSVTSIGEQAFQGCTSLTSMNLPSLTSISRYAFASCTSLTIINLPSSLTSIGDTAFYACESLASIFLPSSLTSIGAGAFQGCTRLSTVALYPSLSLLTSISSYAFAGCTSLTSITLPPKLTSIGANAFGGCRQLTSITILGKAKNLYTQPTAPFWDPNTNAGITVYGTTWDGINSISGINITSRIKPPTSNDIATVKLSIESTLVPTGVTSTSTSIVTNFQDAKDNNPSLSSSVAVAALMTIANENNVSSSEVAQKLIIDAVATIDDVVGGILGATPTPSDGLLNICLVTNGLNADETTNDGEASAALVQSLEQQVPGATKTLNPADTTSLLSSIPDENKASGDAPTSVTVVVADDNNFYLGLTATYFLMVPNVQYNLFTLNPAGTVSYNGNKYDPSVPLMYDGNIIVSETSYNTGDLVQVRWNQYRLYVVGSLLFDNGSGITVQNIAASVNSDNTVTVSWTPPADIPFDHYNITITAGSAQPSTVPVPSTDTSYTTAAFDPTTNVSVSITMVDSEGYESDPSTTGTTGTTPNRQQSSITLTTSNSSLTAVVDTTIQLVSTVLIGGERRSIPVTYTSNNTAVATVSENRITAIGVGTVTITATLSETQDYTSSTADITIDVKPRYFMTDGIITQYNGDLTELTIPISIDGTPVIGIGANAFRDNPTLAIIVLPSSVTSIDEQAFAGCTALASIGLPSSLTSIGDTAFYWCQSLTSISLPSSVTSIGAQAFMSCTALTSIDLPSSVTSIGAQAFMSCTALASIVLPSSVTSIGEATFFGCTSLDSIVLPSSVTSIGASAFAGCTSLDSITLPSKLTSIGASAFAGCTSLTSITLPSKLTSINLNAFGGCPQLTSITILGDSKDLYTQPPAPFWDTNPNAGITVYGTTWDGITSISGININSRIKLLTRTDIDTVKESIESTIFPNGVPSNLTSTSIVNNFKAVQADNQSVAPAVAVAALMTIATEINISPAEVAQKLITDAVATIDDVVCGTLGHTPSEGLLNICLVNNGLKADTTTTDGEANAAALVQSLEQQAPGETKILNSAEITSLLSSIPNKASGDAPTNVTVVVADDNNFYLGSTATYFLMVPNVSYNLFAPNTAGIVSYNGNKYDPSVPLMYDGTSIKVSGISYNKGDLVPVRWKSYRLYAVGSSLFDNGSGKTVQNIAASVNSDNTVTVSWTPPADVSFDHYNITITAGSAQPSTVPVPSTDTSYTTAAFDPTTNVSFSITMVDSEGYESDPSTAAATIPDNTYATDGEVLDVSYNVNNPGTATPTITVSWTDPVGVQVSLHSITVASTGGSTTDTVNSTTFTYTTGSLTPGTSVILSIVMINQYGTLSTPVSITVPVPPVPSPPPSVPCFPAGTPILTPSGYRPVETLRSGDMVVTGTGSIVPIKIYGKKIEVTTTHTAPYLIPAGAFGPKSPSADLRLSPHHAFQIKKGVWMMGALSTNPKVRQYAIGEPVHYYHIECPNYFTDNLVVNGCIVESYAAKQVTDVSKLFKYSARLGGWTRMSNNSVQNKVPVAK